MFVYFVVVVFDAEKNTRNKAFVCIYILVSSNFYLSINREGKKERDE